VGAWGAFPIAGADEDFAVFPAFLAMKFVDWHGCRLIERHGNSRVVWGAGFQFQRSFKNSLNNK
jgi:hypothetical protein